MWYTYDGGHFWGMYWFWWVLWVILIFWIFVTPYDIPGQMKKQDSPLDILRKRYASGQITKVEYQDNIKMLENGSAK